MWTSEEEVSKYAQPRDTGVTPHQAAVAAGIGAGGFGIHHLASTGNVPNQAAERAHQSVANYVQASGKNARAQGNLGHLSAVKENTRNPIKRFMMRGKIKEATVRAENTARELDKTKHLAEVQRTHLSPKAMNARVRNKRLLGASLLAGGTAAVTSPLWAKKKVAKADKPERSKESYTGALGAGLGIGVGNAVMARGEHQSMKRNLRRAKEAKHLPEHLRHKGDPMFREIASERKLWRNTHAGLAGAGAGLTAAAGVQMARKRWEKDINADKVSKTVTQSRYGGNAEMGRQWRGPEKKDAKAPAVALAGAGLGAAGGAVALGAHHSKPKFLPDQTKHLTGEVQRTNQAAQAAGKTHIRDMANYVHGMHLENKVINAPDPQAKKAALVGMRKYKAKHGVGERVYNAPQEKGRDVGRHAPRVNRAMEEKAMASGKTMEAAKETARAAERTLAGHGEARAANAAKRLKHLRLTRAGAGVAALGGATALGAGIKAETDRNKATPGGGWSKPKRTR